MVEKFKDEIYSCREGIIKRFVSTNASSLHMTASLLCELSTVESRYACEEEDRIAIERSGEIAYLNYELSKYLGKYRWLFSSHTRILHRELSQYRKYQLPTNIRVEWQESTNSLCQDGATPAGEIRYNLNPYALYGEAEFSWKNCDMTIHSGYISCITADTDSSTVFFTLCKSVCELDATTNKIIHIFNGFNQPSYLCVCSKYIYILEQKSRMEYFVLKCDRFTGELVAQSEKEQHIYFGITLCSMDRLFVGKGSSLCVYSNDLVKEREIELRISHRVKKHPCIRDLHSFNEVLYMLVYGTFYPFQVFSTDGQLLRVFGLLTPVNSFYFAIDSTGNVLFNDFQDKQIKICDKRGDIVHSITLNTPDYTMRFYCYSCSCICILEPFVVMTHTSPTIFFL